MVIAVKKLFKHGGSYAVDVPMEFIKSAHTKEVFVESSSDSIHITPKSEQDNLESEPMFQKFIQSLAIDAMKHPAKLKDVKDVWDKEWNELLKGVSVKHE
ncbi:MAG: hypothetical protein ACD_79C00211G0003 [uncultured bacterium]|nr:MAG: hypothetical protein ACD_79C00211G0003 [uncultured bacterium]